MVGDRTILLQFDGGLQGKKGSGGFLVWGARGNLLHAAARWYGDGKKTNNEAELEALAEGIAWVRAHPREWALASNLMVVGDSQLILGFLARSCKPSRKFYN